jgi:hypothetical protein
LLATTDAETMRRGRTPKARATKKQILRVIAERTHRLDEVLVMSTEPRGRERRWPRIRYR